MDPPDDVPLGVDDPVGVAVASVVEASVADDGSAVPVSWVAPPILVALEVVRGASSGMQRPLMLVRSS